MQSLNQYTLLIVWQADPNIGQCRHTTRASLLSCPFPSPTTVHFLAKGNYTNSLRASFSELNVTKIKASTTSIQTNRSKYLHPNDRLQKPPDYKNLHPNVRVQKPPSKRHKCQTPKTSIQTSDYKNLHPNETPCQGYQQVWNRDGSLLSNELWEAMQLCHGA